MDHRWSDGEKRSVAGHFAARWCILEAGDTAALGGILRPDAAWYAESPRPWIDPEVTGDSPLLVSLSSGTTGVPKGPRVTHRQFTHRFAVYWIDLGFSAQERFVSATPLYYGGGRGFALAMLTVGASVHMLPPPYDPAALLDYVARERGTAMFLVPTLLRRLLRASPDGQGLPTLRRLVSSGSVLYPEERQAIRQRLTPQLFEFYSSTEGGGVSVLGPSEFERHPDSVGRTCFNVEVQIVDDQHTELPRGSVGRLRYRSPASARGYWRGDDTEAFRDGWFYPGDLALMNDDGYLYLKGRIKDVIIRGGVKIYPVDIENILLATPGVLEAAVAGVPAGELGEEIVAFVAAAPGVVAEDLAARCGAVLAPYKVPHEFVFRTSLPKNTLGKILKHELIASFTRGSRP